MARGQEALALELRRRRPGADPATIPEPAGPTFARLSGWVQKLRRA
jgi:hypothetical protein